MNLDPTIVITGSLGVAIVTQALKKSPLPVTGKNAKVVALVLAVIVVLTPAFLNKGLTQANADTLVAGILLVEGSAIGAYEGAKQVFAYMKATYLAVLTAITKKRG